MAEEKSVTSKNTGQTWIDDMADVSVDTISVMKRRGFSGVTKPVHHIIQGTAAATAANYTAPFFIADRPYAVLEVTERHETLGTSGSAVTLMLKKVPSGTAPASGLDILSAGFDLKASNNTNRFGTILETRTTISGNSVYRKMLAEGDALSLVTTGTLTSVAGVTVSVLLKAL